MNCDRHLNHRTVFSFLAVRLTATTLLASSLLVYDAIAPYAWSASRWFGQSNIAIAQDAEESVNVRVYSAASPAVVSIETATGSGSGSIISADGLVMTNAHVLGSAQTATVVLADGRRFEGEVIAFGEGGLDLAAIRIPNQRNLPTISLARPNSVQVGQRAFAIGNPFGRFQGTFTTGIVSRVDATRGLVQTDAAINPGNSGGPLLNSQGQMIGVNSAIFNPRGSAGNTGIGFAIAIDRVQSFLTAVEEGRAPRTAQQSPMLGGGKPAQRIGLNSSPLSGNLDGESSVLPSDGSFFNAYTFEGRAGQRVVIEMTSDELNPYLILLKPDGTDLAQDDNSAGGNNARVTAVLPGDGLYTVLANSNQAGETGRYQLRVTAPTTTTSTRAVVLLQEQGTLGPRSPQWPEDGSPYQEYQFTGRAGQVVSIEMASPDFETYLMLFGEDGQLVERSNVPNPQNPNASMLVSLPATGTYRVIANAYSRTGRGSYVLTVRQEE
ncbi:trypsin-like peptidase domain-containing protein [Leptolyngbya sp. AN02str]|uniref:trypsin-like peptidase domain-containing protein n=1 Tax=Leptolyngbya sp. AN02str TaxID=3423363 RepID=UPI003D314FCD